MTDVSVKIQLEHIDNGWLATGNKNGPDNEVRCFYEDADDLISSVTEKLKSEIQEARHFSGPNNFSLVIEAHDL